MWFVYFLKGTKITGYYRTTWLSALIAVYVAWGPVALTWLLIYTGMPWAQTLFYYASLTSIIGPLVGYFVPLAVLIMAYS